jgi:SAM-dependent methyltransferase
VTPASDLFLCPECRQPLPVHPPCSCGFVLRETHGVINLLSKAEASALQPFVDAYERVRRAERWGGDDLELPFHAKRHRNIWRIRQRTFRRFESVVAPMPRGLALDVGAGNCWLTRYLDKWGFDAIALDINDSEVDGLRAGQTFIDQGAIFLRARAGMESLPFASGRFRLIAANASFHYAGDFRATLSEFERVLTPGGTIAIVDTPFYKRAADGERMMADRVVEFHKIYGIPESLARRSRYLTLEALEKLAQPLKLNVRAHKVWPGALRTYERQRARLVGRHIAEFPLVLLEKSAEL